MLELIRNHAKGFVTWFILGLVILALASFVLTGYSLNSIKDYVAMVNGEKINERDYQSAYNNYQRALQQNLGANYRPDLINEEFLKQTVVNGLVDRELMHQLLDEAGFRVGPQQVSSEMGKIPVFQGVDNKFSDDAFNATLKRMGLTKQLFQQQYAYDLSLQQLNDAIGKSTFAVAYQADDYQRLEKQQRDIGYAQIAHEKFSGSVKVTDDEVQTYYSTHGAEFMTQEMVKVQYVELHKQDIAKLISLSDAELKKQYDETKAVFSKDDFASAEKKIKDIERRSKQGESFEKLASQFSEDPGSAKSGGDLGFFGPGAMVKPFEDAVLKLKPGEISKPVQSQFGFHLIKLEEIKKEKPEQRRARHILIKPGKITTPFEQVKEKVRHDLQLERAEQQFYEQADKLDKLAYQSQDSLEPAAEQLKLVIKESDFFSRQGGDQIWGNPQVKDAAFSDSVLHQGHNGEVIKLSDSHVIVVRLKTHKPAELKPLEQVKATIDMRLRSEKAKDAAYVQAKQFYEGILASGKPDGLTDAAKQAGIPWRRIGWVGRTANTDADKKTATALAEDIRRISFRLPRPGTDGKPSVVLERLNNGDSVIVAIYAVKDTQDAADKTGREATLRQLSSSVGQTDARVLTEFMRKHSEIELNLPKKEQQP